MASVCCSVDPGERASSLSVNLGGCNDLGRPVQVPEGRAACVLPHDLQTTRQHSEP